MALLTFNKGPVTIESSLVDHAKVKLGGVELSFNIYKVNGNALQWSEVMFEAFGKVHRIHTRLYRSTRYIKNMPKAKRLIADATFDDFMMKLYEIGVRGASANAFRKELARTVYGVKNLKVLLQTSEGQRFPVDIFREHLEQPTFEAAVRCLATTEDMGVESYYTVILEEVAGSLKGHSLNDIHDQFRETTITYLSHIITPIVRNGYIEPNQSLMTTDIARVVLNEVNQGKPASVHVPTPPERKSGSGFKRHGDKGFTTTGKRDRNDVTVPKEYGLKEEHELTHDERLALGVLEKMFGKAVARAMIRGKELGFIKAKESSVVDLDVEVEYEVTVIINLSK